ncbi:Ovochymase-1, partial [Quaeritorhiza haematococci]
MSTILKNQRQMACILWCLAALHIASITAAITPHVSTVNSIVPKKPFSKIVGGNVIEPFKYPFVVSMEYDGHHRCGGFLLSETLIVTAGHCVNPIDAQVDQWWVARFHRHDLRLKPAKENAIGLHVKKVHRHPKYNFTTMQNDIAIFELHEKIPKEAYKPVKFDVTGEYGWTQGLQVNVIGWGDIYNPDMPPTTEGYPFELAHLPSEVLLPIMDNQTCNQIYEQYRTPEDKYEVFPEVMICIGRPELVGREGKGTCNGDSGGPLVAYDTAGEPVVVGLVSWGLESGCGIK